MDKLFIFSMEQWILLIQLLIAHIISDFVLQSNKMAKEKKWFSRFMLIHISVVFMLTFILTKSWLMALVIAVSHYFVDGIKKKIENKNVGAKVKISEIKLFTFDQLAHLLIILIVWFFFSKIGGEKLIKVYELFSDFNFMLILAGYLIVIFPVGYLVGFATKTDKESSDSEKNKGGMIIGIFERIIILTFVLLNQYEAIGFLITGKSIIRFADKNSTLKSEYVLIGTMMSYAMAIIIGVVINYLR